MSYYRIFVPLFLLTLLGLSFEACTRDDGWCVQPNGADQDAGMIKLNSLSGGNEADRRTCVEACLAYSGSTGCEMYTGSSGGCYVHTQPVGGGSGDSNHYCWAFSKCASEIFDIRFVDFSYPQREFFSQISNLPPMIYPSSSPSFLFAT